MKLYAPKYYLDFKCIADRCRHSCCIGWEIDIDPETMEKYSALCSGYGQNIKDSIELSKTPHFRLGENERCPHLDERGLCRIFSNLGEGLLCDICREHPRFYNETPLGREVGLGLSCEEACRIILSSDAFGEIIEVGEVDGEPYDNGFDVLWHRERIFALLSDESISYRDKLDELSGEYSVSPCDLSDAEARSLLSSLEYLDEEHRKLFSNYSCETNPAPDQGPILIRALAYFIYRHMTSATDEYELRAALGFSLFCERLLASCAADVDILTAARIISEEIEYSEDNTDAIKSEFLF